MKKGVAQKIATSKGGKSAAKKVLSPEVMGLLSALKQTVELYAGKQQAEELENAMIRIITKLYFAVDTKQVPIRDLLPADKYLREALKQLSLGNHFFFFPSHSSSNLFCFSVGRTLS
jgi:hypothetical protein